MKLILFSLIPIAFYSCQPRPTQEDIVKAFRNEDSSLARSNALVITDDSVSYYYNMIKLKGNAPLADSVYKTLQTTEAIIQKAQDILIAKDSAGTDTLIAGKLLNQSPLGDSITTSMALLSRQCLNGVSDKDEISRLNGPLPTLTGLPTVAALTILAHFKLENAKAVLLTFKDLAHHR